MLSPLSLKDPRDKDKDKEDLPWEDPPDPVTEPALLRRPDPAVVDSRRRRRRNSLPRTESPLRRVVRTVNLPMTTAKDLVQEADQDLALEARVDARADARVDKADTVAKVVKADTVVKVVKVDARVDTVATVARVTLPLVTLPPVKVDVRVAMVARAAASRLKLRIPVTESDPLPTVARREDSSRSTETTARTADSVALTLRRS